MVYHIPTFRFERFDQTSEGALVCEIICDNWEASGGSMM